MLFPICAFYVSLRTQTRSLAWVQGTPCYMCMLLLPERYDSGSFWKARLQPGPQK